MPRPFVSVLMGTYNHERDIEQAVISVAERVIRNTSFNLRGAAIVPTPTEAVGTFFSSAMDALVIGSFLVEK